MDQGEAKSPPPKPKRYVVVSANQDEELERKINDRADKGYTPVLMAIRGAAVVVILEHD